jgi:hypothetical protein
MVVDPRDFGADLLPAPAPRAVPLPVHRGASQGATPDTMFSLNMLILPREAVEVRWTQPSLIILTNRYHE